eukprot:Lithocolla_globosa_v1_NODE_1230_length_2754_cov_22.616525.p3 type:complete len:123 gc:universal NODE_1230_length_2754_cov_22.616525:2216-1848(-)
MDYFASSLQSWYFHHLEDGFAVSVTTSKFPSGGGLDRKVRMVNASDSFKKQSVNTIINEGNNMCGVIALLVGLAYHNKSNDPAYYKKISHTKYRKEQTERAKEVYDKLGKDYDDPCTLKGIS